MDCLKVIIVMGGLASLYFLLIGLFSAVIEGIVFLSSLEDKKFYRRLKGGEWYKIIAWGQPKNFLSIQLGRFLSSRLNRKK